MFLLMNEHRRGELPYFLSQEEAWIGCLSLFAVERFWGRALSTGVMFYGCWMHALDITAGLLCRRRLATVPIASAALEGFEILKGRSFGVGNGGSLYIMLTVNFTVLHLDLSPVGEARSCCLFRKCFPNLTGHIKFPVMTVG